MKRRGSAKRQSPTVIEASHLIAFPFFLIFPFLRTSRASFKERQTIRASQPASQPAWLTDWLKRMIACLSFFKFFFHYSLSQFVSLLLLLLRFNWNGSRRVTLICPMTRVAMVRPPPPWINEHRTFPAIWHLLGKEEEEGKEKDAFFW